MTRSGPATRLHRSRQRSHCEGYMKPINAARAAGQAADRMAQAKALTSSPSSSLADALARRAAMQPSKVAPNTTGTVSALARAIAAQQQQGN
jgi:hypothetical protein